MNRRENRECVNGAVQNALFSDVSVLCNNGGRLVGHRDYAGVKELELHVIDMFR